MMEYFHIAATAHRRHHEAYLDSCLRYHERGRYLRRERGLPSFRNRNTRDLTQSRDERCRPGISLNAWYRPVLWRRQSRPVHLDVGLACLLLIMVLTQTNRSQMRTDLCEVTRLASDIFGRMLVDGIAGEKCPREKCDNRRPACQRVHLVPSRR